MRTRVLLILTSLSLLLCTADTADAGRLYARRRGTASPLYNLQLENIRTTVTIRNLLAVTHVDEQFRNTQSLDLEGFYVFQLPEGATVDGLWMWVDGVRETFAVKRLEDAMKQYDTLVQQGIGDPAILQSLGSNRFQLSVYPIRAGSVRRIELQYFETLAMNENGMVQYAYPLALAGYQSTPVTSTAITLSLGMDCGVDSIATSFDTAPLALTTQRMDSSHLLLALTMDNLVQSKDLIVNWRMPYWHDRFSALAWVDPDTLDNDYFMAWLPFRLNTTEMAYADYVIAIDKSGSMCGLRRELAIDAFTRLLGKLQRYDRFRLVFFSNTATSYPADTSMLFATPDNIKNAVITMIAAMQPDGLTNYEAAISAGMASAFRFNADQRFLLLTDGLANAGMKTASALLPLLSRGDSVRVRFYPITMYTERISELYSLATGTQGRLTTIEQGDDLASAVERIAFDFSSRTVSSPGLSWPQGVSFTYPMAYPARVKPEEVVAAGRFQPSSAGDVHLICMYRNKYDTIRVARGITLEAGADTLVEIGRYWASLRIAYLLDQLKTVTDSSEIRESVIRLSEKFMLLTPFTAFIVVHDVHPPVNAVDDMRGVLARGIELRQNYPNPFNPSTTISFTVPDGAALQHVRVVVYDVTGREIVTLWDGPAPPGIHHLVWNGLDTHGATVASGTYICMLRTADVKRTITMHLVR